MNEREYDKALAALPEEIRNRIKAYQGIPLGAAYALNQEQQAIKESLGELKDSLQAISHTLLRLLGEHTAKIDALEKKSENLDGRLRRVEDKLGICV